ncbi:superoxide dismutase [Idiomarina xiamenensis]|uniref:Superoxide dismutase n=1 Tax=Idiomarina xiamenensis 10-D-4 TaxID=740709 RepID=K2KJW0_9GAMM|nr:superoxide dismutase [Idiomarina xiamenensis]EKE82884.1 Superoxide dismutase [Idiomarina xiamenensis 10-D-4]
MSIELPPLPYDKQALEPYMSAETLTYHHDKHHAAYVNKLNELIAGSELEDHSLEDIIWSAKGVIFNNAAQIWNHNFFWHCLTPQGGGEPPSILLNAIMDKWGSFEAFKKQFTEQAIANFGSGWTWLVNNEQGKLSIVNTANADTPLTHAGITPILTVDVWEHAYYIDHRNARVDYLAAFWALVNWNFVQQNYVRDLS